MAAFSRAGASAARAASSSRGYSGVTKTTLLRVASSRPSSPEKRAASRYWPSATSGTVHSSVPATAAGAASTHGLAEVRELRAEDVVQRQHDALAQREQRGWLPGAGGTRA